MGADDRGRTALHVAAAEGWENTVSFLIEYGADVNAIDNDGQTPLEDAIHSGCSILIIFMSHSLWEHIFNTLHFYVILM